MPSKGSEGNRFKRLAVWTSGGLVMAIAGNAMWELTRPAVVWSGRLILNIATLGMSRLRDGLYEDVARGDYDWFGQWFNSLFGGVVSGFLMGVLVVMWIFRKKDEGDAADAASEMKPSLFGRIVDSNWTVVIYSLSVILFVLVQTTRINYIHRAATYAEQMQAIIAPYISEQDAAVLRSRLAQAASSKEYKTIIEEMRAIADKNQAKWPEFEIF